RQLGSCGLRVSPICLGTDNYGNPTTEADAEQILLRALDAGINFIDTADMYAGGESERMIGRFLRATGRRDEVVLATKGHYPTGPGPNDRGNSRIHIQRAVDESLRRLQTDVIDLYQLHRPDFSLPLDETLRALDDLVRAGKVRYIGSSTAPAWHITEALLTSELRGYVRFVCEQSPYNLLDRRVENELLPMVRRFGLGLITWSPLAMGMLAGRYRAADAPPSDSRAVQRGGIYAERVTARGVEVGNQFAALARTAGLEPASAAVAWLLAQPGLTAPIIGPKTVAQLDTLLPALTMVLPADFIAACDELAPPGGVIASFFNSAPWMAQKIV
ncbi:MAG: aldo/keto reductase, partial [Caldilineaceae bacterium]